ncbi:MAG: molybdate ABC transporter substrate-binding protein [Bacillota bacterium]
MKRYLKAIALLVIFGLFLTVQLNSVAAETDSLLVYCGAGLKKPMQELGQQFEAKYGIKVDYQFNGSGALFNQIKTVQSGDLYMPGDVWYLDQLEETKYQGASDYIYQSQPVAYHTPVVVTPNSNPAGIKEFNDLAKSDLKAILGDESVAIGRITKKILSKVDFTVDPIAKMGTVNQVAMTLAMGQGEAGIVWRANYDIFSDRLKMIEIPRDINEIKDLSIAVLETSKEREAAVKFMNFVASQEGKAVFADYGYKTVEE